MISRAVALFLFMASAVPAALAGDVADRQILGFSADGRAFAFEEYGIQDGSGFPYSNIYVIDTMRDSWIAGSPVRIRIDGDAPPLHEARAEALDLARPILERVNLFPGDRPGTHLLSNPVTEVSADPHRVEVLTRPVLPPIESPIVLRIDEFPLTASQCLEGTEGRGFRLTLVRDGKQTVLHEDRGQVPASRFCPDGYRIADVLAYRPPEGPAEVTPVLAVLVAFTRFGFEGPDVRWLAVTAPLP